MTEFIVERAAPDYLSLTSWDGDFLYRAMHETHTPEEIREAKKERIKRYAGVRIHHPGGSIFFGEGQQKNPESEITMPHYMVSASGAAASPFSLFWAGDSMLGVSVTRFDVQLTLPLPDWYKSQAFLSTLRDGDWKGKSPHCTLIDNYGDDTVYVGSGQSDRRCRWYIKETDWIRCEYQYRKEYAESAFSRYKRSPTIACAGILVSELVKYPAHPIVVYFLEKLSGANRADVQGRRPEKSTSRTFRWFKHQVVPALRKMLNDHDLGERVASELRDLIEQNKEGKEG